MSEHKNNLCDGCALWPCGTHAPIGVDGCIVTECANRKPTSGETIATLKAQCDELLAVAKELVVVLRAEPTMNNQKYDALGARFLAAIANADKDKT